MISWYHITSCACLLLLFMVWKEISRQKKSRLFWRLFCSVIAVLALTALAMDNHRDQAETKKAVWITSGYNHDSVARFLELQEENLPIYSNDDSIDPAILKNASTQKLNDPSIFADGVKPAAIDVFGDGLDADELQVLNQVPILFHPTEAGVAIRSISWTQKVQAGQRFFLQGTLDNHSNKPVTLFLKTLAEISDSVVVQPGKLQQFGLHSIPNHLGTALYSLLTVSGHDTLANEPVPVEIQSPATWKILLLASSPGFENKFLKNWLYHHGYSLTVITGISRNKFARQFLNTPESNSRITPSFLDKFDVLITSDDELRSLATNELEFIRLAVNIKGMGLIVRSDSAARRNTFYSEPFPISKSAHSAPAHSMYIEGEDSTRGRFVVSIEDAQYIRYQGGNRVLLRDAQSNIFAGSSLYGNGNIVSTTLQETYSLVISGNHEGYAALWSMLLQSACRNRSENNRWYTQPAVNHPGEKVRIQLEFSSINSPSAQIEKSRIPFKQNSLLPFQWEASYWPDQNGWQTVLPLEGQRYRWYVYGSADWKQLFAWQKTNATKKYALEHPYPEGELRSGRSKSGAHLPRPLCVIAFFICCGFLWAERKI